MHFIRTGDNRKRPDPYEDWIFQRNFFQLNRNEKKLTSSIKKVSFTDESYHFIEFFFQSLDDPFFEP